MLVYAVLHAIFICFSCRKNWSRNITFLYDSNETGPSSVKAGDRRCYWRGGRRLCCSFVTVTSAGHYSTERRVVPRISDRSGR